MQTIWIVLLIGILSFCFTSKAVPVEITEPNDDAESRIIIPPELPLHHFEILKEKSDKSDNQTNCAKNKPDDNSSTPLNYLRDASDGPTQNFVSVMNLSSKSQPSIVAFEGNKQIPIYITIPIYINGGSQAQPPQILGVDNGAVVSAPAFLRKVPEIEEENVMNTRDLKKAFKKLLKEAYEEEKNSQGRRRQRWTKSHRKHKD